MDETPQDLPEFGSGLRAQLERRGQLDAPRATLPPLRLAEEAEQRMSPELVLVCPELRPSALGIGG
ncbi:MAG: hypothetical protein ACRDN6_02265 [Gaiellaceae bacterium]